MDSALYQVLNDKGVFQIFDRSEVIAVLEVCTYQHMSSFQKKFAHANSVGYLQATATVRDSDSAHKDKVHKWFMVP